MMATYSYSKLESFKRCPYQYKLNYLDKIKTGIENIEAFLGSRFHELMEEIFSKGKEKDYFLEELIGRFRALWKQKWHSQVRILDAGKTPEDYLAYGEQCVKNFYEAHLAPGTGFPAKTLGVEIRIEFPIDPQKKNKMIGYIDRIAETADGTVEIQDYKTSMALPEEEELSGNRQLAIYQIGLLSGWKKEGREPLPTRLVLYYVGHSKTFSFPGRSQDQIVELLEEVRSDIASLERETLFAAHVSSFCKWCSYQDMCEAFRKAKASRAS
jgi:RecB family exonuclease